MLWSIKRQALTKETAHIREAMKREDFFCASSHFSSRGHAKKSKRKISKPCYAKDFSWFLCIQFTFGRAASIRRDKRFSFYRLLFFSVRISQKAWSLNVFTWLFVFEVAFSRRLFHLAFRRKQTHDARSANKNFWLFILLRLHLPRRKFSVCICRMEQKTQRNPRSAKRNIWVLFCFVRFACAGWTEDASTMREAQKQFLGFLLFFAVCIRRMEQKTPAQCAKRKKNFCFGFSFSDRT